MEFLDVICLQSGWFLKEIRYKLVISESSNLDNILSS